MGRKLCDITGPRSEFKPTFYILPLICCSVCTTETIDGYRCSDGSKIMKWGPKEPPTFKNGPLKHDGSHRLQVMNKSNTLVRFSEGHSAAQLSCLCGIL